jgi:hypothetical protein
MARRARPGPTDTWPPFMTQRPGPKRQAQELAAAEAEIERRKLPVSAFDLIRWRDRIDMLLDAVAGKPSAAIPFLPPGHEV